MGIPLAADPLRECSARLPGLGPGTPAVTGTGPVMVAQAGQKEEKEEEGKEEGDGCGHTVTTTSSLA